MAEAQVFTKLEVFNRVRGGTLVAWELNAQFPISGSLTFEIKVSRSGVGDWLSLGTATDTYAFIDNRQWIGGKDTRVHYMVSFTSGGTTYESCVFQPLANLPKRDRVLLKEMVRKEQLRLETLAGICGYLYKRRIWGQRCTTCLDYNTSEVKDAHCPECYGVGITGGYFEPVSYWLSETAAKPRRRVTDPARGRVDDQVSHKRGVNCPWVDSGDVWIDFDSDQRYVIHSIKNLDYRGYTIVFDPIELRLAPASDVIYRLPRPDDESSSSSSS